MTQADAYRMIHRCALKAGSYARIGIHSFRATGITEYLRNGGKLERAQQIANHESSAHDGPLRSAQRPDIARRGRAYSHLIARQLRH
jgi:hypothetical protein